MTNEKAIELIKNICFNVENHIEEEKCLNYQIALNMALKAIAKQVPQKVDLIVTSKVKAVDVETKKIYTYPVVRCTNCDKPMTFHKERKFCEHCGKALDWGDGE